ncbi:energy-coupling factor ABC transporter permease [Williamsia sp. CHRR-6]|uniref:energy-coupling factor ABC transporter permease n=1 Tax=Williamsia sp. CHRR-6 TaxID=2835871 RepID=UPI001BDAE02C|nr:energy-coupling factor ABC transporter permease [Williamsia sp. CHRR-6]MBT0567540.1 energy-coupling factor ABC transporter permease [Williamsia sp. CHRR-6]
MHIEPGIVEGPKIILSYLTAGGVGAVAAQLGIRHVRERGMSSLAVGSMLSTVAVFVFFQIFPHVPVGVSEVHLILGSTLFLIFGAAPAAVGLAAGLLVQGVFFAPFDLPQYGMNVTTLLVPLFTIGLVAKRVIPAQRAYVDLTYRQVLALSSTYQAGIVGWVTFWALYGEGVSASTLAAIATFGLAYLTVILIEPLADLAVLAAAKWARRLVDNPITERRLFAAA